MTARTAVAGVCRIRRGGLHNHQEATMKGIVLWLLGVPVGVIVLLYLFNIL